MTGVPRRTLLAVVAVLVAAVVVTGWWVRRPAPGGAPDPGAAPSTPAPTPSEEVPPVVDLRLATFNLLASRHTRPGGDRPGFAPAEERMGGVLEVLARHDLTLVGLQEFEGDQRAAFAARATGWRAFPGTTLGPGVGENSVAWRSDTWAPVRTELVEVPYFRGRLVRAPYVLLRHRETGLRVWLSTFHNPASTPRNPGQQVHRDAATDAEIALFLRLEATGVPQLVTGDMNERGHYFCRVTAATPLTSPAGGSHDGGRCRPPETGIDQVFGSPGVRWTSYDVHRDALVRRTTDHPVVVVGARIDAADFPRARRPGAGSDQADED
ncbi:Endonuclease/Exonuclease/phosphatase family protein [Nocardioides scoriae]|uniref:Endonuclease/Exonuclease/phosphatase family protein n=1 Tax=Nocardioides scoriae TaxID=642780 RepID=A0A1H1UFG3_9ACTN|nr:endonuclease/exonuclease/phosphatase family protein [Nocardioides scoriae]SDS71255.1 Endonuclease/Exonuclease/phosphatase family protein [Nocardioides scoriae]